MLRPRNIRDPFRAPRESPRPSTPSTDQGADEATRFEAPEEPEAIVEASSNRRDILVPFGSERHEDILGDHDLMRTVLLNCVDNAWYGGAVFASRVHFDTHEVPERRNVHLIKGGRRLLEGYLDERGRSCLPVDPVSSTRDAPVESLLSTTSGRRSSSSLTVRASSYLERLCREDVAAVFDGGYWVPVGVDDCVLSMNMAFVEAISGYLRDNPGLSHDVAPAVEEMIDGYRMGVLGHHVALSESIASVLDKHALSPAEFAEVSGII